MPTAPSPVVTIKIYPPEPVEVRKALLNGYERVQRLGYIMRKIVYMDLVTFEEVPPIIDAEFPGANEDGGFVFENAQYQDVFCKMGKVVNVVLTGTKRLPTTGIS